MIYQQEQRAKQCAEKLSRVKEKVESVRRELPRVGTRKLYFLLKEQFNGAGIKIGRDALFDFLRAEHMLIKAKKSYTKTTNSKHWLKKHPNLYAPDRVERTEQYFLSDITYLKTIDSTYYLSLVTDAFSRKIMGYKVSDTLNAEHMVEALDMAVKNRVTSSDLIHHSDRGLQYASELYQKRLRKYQIRPSMTDGYDCYQNALAERVNGILKNEFLIYKCNSRKDLEKLVEESVRTYNEKRPHLSLKMQTPNFVHKKTTEQRLSGSF